MSMDANADNALVEGCRSQDDACWERLFSKWAGPIYRWAVLLGLGGADAEDAAQDVLATAASRIDSVHSDHALPVWLYQITRRVVANRRRLVWLRRVGGLDNEPEPAFDLSGSTALDEELAVRACLRRLPRRQVEMLVLMDIEGFTREEAAKALGVPAGTVASRLRSARSDFEKLWRQGNALPGATPPRAVNEPIEENV